MDSVNNRFNNNYQTSAYIVNPNLSQSVGG